CLCGFRAREVERSCVEGARKEAHELLLIRPPDPVVDATVLSAKVGRAFEEHNLTDLGRRRARIRPGAPDSRKSMTPAFGLELHLRHELNYARPGRVADITAEGRVAQRTHRQREAGIVEKVEEFRAEFDCAGFAERGKPEISEHGKIG